MCNNTTPLVICLIILTLSVESVQATLRVTEIPNGMLAYFEGPCQYPHWKEIAKEYRGRAIVSTSKATDHGSVVGQSMLDGELPSHNHTFSKTCMANQASYDIGGISYHELYKYATPAKYCVNSTDAFVSTTNNSIPLVQLRLCEYISMATTAPAASSNLKNEVIPVDTIAHFSPSIPNCPTGWIPFEVSQGRLMIMSGYASHGTKNKDVDSINTSIISSNQLGIHSHSFTLSFQVDPIPSDRFTGIDGNPNYVDRNYLTQYPPYGTFNISGVVGNSSINLAYAQLLTCKIADTSNTAVRNWNDNTDSWPSDKAMMFRDRSATSTTKESANEYDPQGCGDGWEEVSSDVTGRVIISTPSNSKKGPNSDGTMYRYGGKSKITGWNDDKIAHHHLLYGNKDIDAANRTVNKASVTGNKIPVYVQVSPICAKCYTFPEPQTWMYFGTYGISPTLTDEDNSLHIPYLLTLACRPKKVTATPTTAIPTSVSPTNTPTIALLQNTNYPTFSPTPAILPTEMPITSPTIKATDTAENATSQAIVVGALCDSRRGGLCCSNQDWDEAWARNELSGYSTHPYDVSTCQSSCNDKLPNYDDFAKCVGNCMDNNEDEQASQLLKGPKYTPQCASCFGLWASCEQKFCKKPCSTSGDRASKGCVECDVGTGCDELFSRCSGISNPREDPTQKESSMAYPMIAVAAGSALLTGLSAFGFIRLRRRRRNNETEISKLAKESREIINRAASASPSPAESKSRNYNV